MQQFDRNKSLQELEGQAWGEPDFPSQVVTECHRLRRIALRELTPENLRLMIGQQIGLPYLVSLALELLRVDPFAEGDFYRGDLLAAVLRVDATFWGQHPELRRETEAVMERAFSSLRALDDIDKQTAEPTLTQAYAVFARSDKAER